MSDSSPRSPDSTQAEKAFTPASGCKAGPGARCGSLGHLGGLIVRDDGTWSCRTGFAQAQKHVPCGCSQCGGELVREDKATRLSATYIAAYYAKELEQYRTDPTKIFVDGAFTKEAKVLGLIASIKDAETAKRIRFLEAHVRPAIALLNEGVSDEGFKPGMLRVKGGANIWLPVIMTADEYLEERERLRKPVETLIERILAAKHVQWGEQKNLDGVRHVLCTSAAQKRSVCLCEDPWVPTETADAFCCEGGKRIYAFGPGCTAAVAHRFKPTGKHKALVLHAIGVEGYGPASADSIGKLGEVMGHKTDASRPTEEVRVHRVNKHPWQRVRAVEMLAPTLPESQYRRLLNELRKLKAETPEEHASRVEKLYADLHAEVEAANAAKAQEAAVSHRSASVAAVDENWGRCKKLLKGPPISATDEDFRTALEGLSSNASVKARYDAVVQVVASRKADEARAAVVTEAVNAGMFSNAQEAEKAFEQDDLDAMKAKVKAFWLENGAGTEAEVAAILPETPSVEATPGPRGTALEMALAKLTADGRFQVKARSGASRSDPSYGAAKAAPPKQGGDKNKKEGKSQGRASRGTGKSSKEGAAAAAAT